MEVKIYFLASVADLSYSLVIGASAYTKEWR